MKPITKTENIIAWLAIAMIAVAVGSFLFFLGARPPYSGGFALLLLLISVAARQRVRRILGRIEGLVEKEPKDDPSEPARFI
jgi:membrane protein implicated in regulation of membrane protease activity